ncbi:hypothetical protein MYSTI_04491 [Myxococcus stipitatus DSM 14675]|uniref:Uncharacterized protein n=1 Tax=Myxococcus stipitatus (strain DSM 14675 / JCM 12634 / Mx s8) TaxID=1278073 RepID=L7UH51_MYXSD|nr:hypothetical protein [Myxococcus stipitatus]AGC45784.1 hypothetical protein MYSTI_04491 [Myxococcus stipitatus DSM 14675]
MRDVAHSTLPLADSRSASELIRSMLPKLYGVEEHPPRATVTEHYHPDATFQGPWVTVQGLENVRRLVYVHRTFFSGCQLSFIDIAESVRPDGLRVVLADVACALVFKRFLAWRPWQKLMGDTVSFQAVHKFVLDADLRIVSHEESFSAGEGDDALPLGWMVYSLLRRGGTSDFGYTLNQYIAGDRTVRTVL